MKKLAVPAQIESFTSGENRDAFRALINALQKRECTPEELTQYILTTVANREKQTPDRVPPQGGQALFLSFSKVAMQYLKKQGSSAALFRGASPVMLKEYEKFFDRLLIFFVILVAFFVVRISFFR